MTNPVTSPPVADAAPDAAARAGALGDDALYRLILVPTDGHPLSGEAILHAVKLASRVGAKLIFVTVTEPFLPRSLMATQIQKDLGNYDRQAKAQAEKILAAAGAAATAAGVSFEAVHEVEEDPYRAIVKLAEERRCDLIVMASHGRRGLSALVLGSETVKVLTHSSIPVLVCRAQRTS